MSENQFLDEVEVYRREKHYENNLGMVVCKRLDRFEKFIFFGDDQESSEDNKQTNNPKLLQNLTKVHELLDKKLTTLSINFIKEKYVSCPYCLNPIEKRSGCNDMYCVNCTNHFNYNKNFSGNYARGIEPMEISHDLYKILNSGPNGKNAPKHLLTKEIVKIQMRKVNDANKRVKKFTPSQRRLFRNIYGSGWKSQVTPALASIITPDTVRDPTFLEDVRRTGFGTRVVNQGNRFFM